jgi:hypothetical protein
MTSLHLQLLSSRIFLVNFREQLKLNHMFILCSVAPKNPEVIIIGGAESEDSDDDSDDEEAAAEAEEEEGEEEEDEEGEKTLMFEKRVTLLIQDPETAVWSTQGLGDLQILYDHEICGARIYVEQDGTGEQLCNTIITLDTVLEVRNME